MQIRPLTLDILFTEMNSARKTGKGDHSSQQPRPVAISTGPVATTAYQERREDAASQVEGTSPLTPTAADVEVWRCGAWATLFVRFTKISAGARAQPGPGSGLQAQGRRHNL